MGWSMGWASAGGSDFNRDMGFTHTEEELRPFLEGEIPLTVKQNAECCGTDAAGYVAEGPGLSAYALSDGTVYRTYVSTARGLEPAMAYYGLLDRTPAAAKRLMRRSGCVATTSTRPAERTRRTPRRARGPARSAGRWRRAGGRPRRELAQVGDQLGGDALAGQQRRDARRVAGDRLARDAADRVVDGDRPRCRPGTPSRGGDRDLVLQRRQRAVDRPATRRRRRSA